MINRMRCILSHLSLILSLIRPPTLRKVVQGLLWLQVSFFLNNSYYLPTSLIDLKTLTKQFSVSNQFSFKNTIKKCVPRLKRDNMAEFNEIRHWKLVAGPD